MFVDADVSLVFLKRVFPAGGQCLQSSFKGKENKFPSQKQDSQLQDGLAIGETIPIENFSVRAHYWQRMVPTRIDLVLRQKMDTFTYDDKGQGRHGENSSNLLFGG